MIWYNRRSPCALDDVEPHAGWYRGHGIGKTHRDHIRHIVTFNLGDPESRPQPGVKGNHDGLSPDAECRAREATVSGLSNEWSLMFIKMLDFAGR